MSVKPIAYVQIYDVLKSGQITPRNQRTFYDNAKDKFVQVNKTRPKPGKTILTLSSVPKRAVHDEFHLGEAYVVMNETMVTAIDNNLRDISNFMTGDGGPGTVPVDDD